MLEEAACFFLILPFVAIDYKALSKFDLDTKQGKMCHSVETARMIQVHWTLTSNGAETNRNCGPGNDIIRLCSFARRSM